MPHKDPEVRREYMKRYTQETKERRREYGKKYRELNKEKIKETKRLEHLEKRKDPEYRAAANARAKQWREDNPERQARAVRRSKLMREYGLTEEDYDRLLESQGRGCAICGDTDPGVKNRTQLFVDHDHTTGLCRGLLCNKCNLGLAQFKDDPALLAKAMEYLKEAEDADGPG